MSIEPNKYYDPTSIPTFAQKATKQEVLSGEDLSDKHIKNLCTGFLVNAIYANTVESSKDFEQGREESITIAAQVITRQGREIKEQLDQNDKAELEAPSSDPEPSQDRPNTSADIKKISGGTMAKIIKKIAEIMASMSPEEQNSASENFSAVFEVLERCFDKTAQTMQNLASEPVVVANIKNMLEGTAGEAIFDKLIEDHLTPSQQAAITEISREDLDAYRSSAQQQEHQTGLILA